jgi:hypothetical protein
MSFFSIIVFYHEMITYGLFKGGDVRRSMNVIGNALVMPIGELIVDVEGRRWRMWLVHNHEQRG